MSKVTLTFDIPEEREEMLQAIHGSDAFAVVFELYNNYFRKYESRDMSDQEHKLLEEIRGDINEMIQDSGVEDIIT